MYKGFIFCCNALHITRTVKRVIMRDSALLPKFDLSDIVVGLPVGHSSSRSSRKNLPWLVSRMSSPMLGGGTATLVCLVSFLVIGLFAAMFSLVL